MENNFKATKYIKLESALERDFLKDLDYKKEIPEKRTNYEKFMENLKPGITVGLVNLPLCISLAVASGSTPEAGILSGIIAGICSGFAGGSNYNIVGPTGALSGFLSNLVFRYGVSSLPYFAMATGVLTYFVKVYGLEKYIDLFPTAVNEGFTVGVACIIFFGQMNSALGIGKIISLDDSEAAQVVHKEHETLVHTIINNITHIHQMKMQAFIIFLFFFVSLYLLIKNYPTIPWMIIAALVGILIGICELPVDTLKTKYGDLSLNPLSFSYIKETNPAFLLDPRLWVDALPIVFVAVLETLISAKIADSMTNTRFKKDKEIRGLALANVISGLFGGIPVTAALARTALNIKSGCSHKYSSVINGGLLFLLGIVFISFFKYLPMCVVAAQVCIVAVRMVNYTELGHLYHDDRKSFIILMVIGVICVVQDPIVGIILGMLIYLINFCDSLTQPWAEIILRQKQLVSQSEIVYVDQADEQHQVHASDIPKNGDNLIVYRIIGIINFMNTPEHIDKLSALVRKQDHTIVISLRYMHYVDLDALHALKHLIERVEKIEQELNKTNKIYVTGLSSTTKDMIKNEKWIAAIKEMGILLI